MPIEDETMGNKKVEFQAIVGPNADLAANPDIRNIGKLDGKFYIATSDGDDALIITVDEITGASTIYDTYTRGVGTTVLSSVCRVIDGKVRALHTTFNGVTYAAIVRSTFTEGGVTYGGSSDAFGVDLFGDSLGRLWYMASDYKTVGPNEYTIRVGRADTAGSVWKITTDGLSLHSIWAGKCVGTVYTYYYVHLGGGLYKCELELASGTPVLTRKLVTDLTLPANYNINDQQFWIQNDTEFWVSQDNFYYRHKNASNWASISGTTESNNGMVWDYDEDGKYILTYVSWKDILHKVFLGGGIAAIQPVLFDGKCGWDDWINDPVGGNIYEYTLVETEIFTMGINDKLSSGNICRLLWNIEPNTNIFHIITDADGVALFQGWCTVYGETPTGGNVYYSPELHEGIEQDLKQKVTEKYVNKTIPFILKDVAAKYCNFIWAGRGTDSTDESNDWKAGDSLVSDHGWEVVSAVDHEEVISEWNGHTNVWEITDAGAGQLEKTGYNASSFTMEEWITIDTIGAYKWAYFLVRGSAGQAICGILFDQGTFAVYKNGASTSISIAYVVDQWYHCRLSYVASGACEIWIDGVSVHTWTDTTGLNVENNFIGVVGATAHYDSISINPTPFVAYNSISVVPTNPYSPDWKGKSVADIIKWADNTTGYTSSFTAEYQWYFNQMVESGVTIAEDNNLSGIPSKKVKSLKVSIVELFGAAVDGKPLHVVVQGEGNFGKLQDRYTEVTTEAELLKTANQLLTDKELTIVSLIVSYQNVGFLRAGMSVIINLPTYGITDDVYFITSNTYDALNDINTITCYSVLYRPWQNNPIGSLQQYVDNLNLDSNSNEGNGLNPAGLFSDANGNHKVAHGILGKNWVNGDSLVTDHGWEVVSAVDNEEVITSLDGHNLVEKIADAGNARIVKRNVISATTTAVEFWIRSESSARSVYLSVIDAANVECFGINLDAGNIEYYHDGISTDSGVNYVVDQWYHFRCTFIKNGTCEVFMNGNETPIATYTDTAHTPISITIGLVITTGFWDAIGVFDDGYEKNTNIAAGVVACKEIVIDGKTSAEMAVAAVAAVSKWHPCGYSSTTSPSSPVTANAYLRPSSSSQYMLFMASLPSEIGALKLQITGVRMKARVCDASNTITGLWSYKLGSGGRTLISAPAINLNTTDESLSTTHTAVHIIEYEQVSVEVLVGASNGSLTIFQPEVQYHYE